MKIRFNGKVFPNLILLEALSPSRNWKQRPKKDMSSNHNNVIQIKIITRQNKIIK